MMTSDGSGLDHVAARIRGQAQAARAGIVRYVVPYSAPGIKRGQLRIDAESSAEALDQAREIHSRSYRLASNLGWAGPGYSRSFSPAPSRHKLTKSARSQIIYGEPVAQREEGAA